MNKNDYRNNLSVASFTSWLAEKSTSLPIHLTIKSSSKVPGGLNEKIEGFDNVVQKYIWRAEWQINNQKFSSSDWNSTKNSLENLSTLPTKAIGSNNNDLFLKSVFAVFKWGGIRNIRTGAGAFVNEHKNHLIDYFVSTSKSLELDHVSLNDQLHVSNNEILLMNAMLTKVYALLSNDGLPIYDSRVAAAIATLVELWSLETKELVPNVLKFPSTERTRSAPRTLSSNNHGVINRSNMLQGTQDWVSAKVRLGWIINEVLIKNKDVFKSEGSLNKRMHAFEAALFMIGYDTRSLIKK